MKLDPLNDGISSIELVDSMGNDLSIINCARVSYNNYQTELTEKDIKLLKYLWEHKHYSPFRSVVFTFKAKAPLFVCRQFFKHLVASSHVDEQLQFNEVSFRYTEAKDPNEFYIPQQFRTQSKSNKQCSDLPLAEEENKVAIELYAKQCKASYETYQKLIQLGVGREQARGVLVPAIYTSWIWTTSLQALLNFLFLRSTMESQYEIRCYANSIPTLVKDIIPETLKLLN